MDLDIQPVRLSLKEYKQVKQLYMRAFPKYEREPWTWLLIKSKYQRADFMAFYDQEQFVGFAYVIIFCISQLMIKSVLKDTGHGLLMNFVAFTLRIRWLWTLSSLILKRQITNSGYDDLNFIGAMAFSQLQNFSKRKKSLSKF